MVGQVDDARILDESLPVELPVPKFAEVAALYRDLRRSAESSGNEPGAADFYYGEMEMRRHSDAEVPERAILFAYWLLSGYGLRAWRSFVALLAVLVMAVVIVHQWGFTSPNAPGPASSILFVLRAVLWRTSEPPGLTTVGASTAVAMVLIAPALLAMGLLAVRARVKR